MTPVERVFTDETMRMENEAVDGNCSQADCTMFSSRVLSAVPVDDFSVVEMYAQATNRFGER